MEPQSRENLLYVYFIHEDDLFAHSVGLMMDPCNSLPGLRGPFHAAAGETLTRFTLHFNS